jgi:hypothetical protein
VSAAILVLVSFEVVFVTNVMYRLVFGPPVQDVRGHLYLLNKYPPIPQSSDPALLVWLAASMCALAVATPLGWWAGRLDGHGRRLPVAVMTSMILWALINLQLSFAGQFLSMLSLVIGFLTGGRLAVAAERRASGL